MKIFGREIQLVKVTSNGPSKQLYTVAYDTTTFVLRGRHGVMTFAYPPVVGRPLPTTNIRHRKFYRLRGNTPRRFLMGEKPHWILVIAKRNPSAPLGYWRTVSGVVGQTIHVLESAEYRFKYAGPVAEWVPYD